MAANAEAGAGTADTDAGRTVAASAREAPSDPSAGADAVTADGASEATDGPPETESKPTRRQRIWRVVGRGVALLAVAITVMMIALAIGMRSNDSAIDDHLGTATATVLSVANEVISSCGDDTVVARTSTLLPNLAMMLPAVLRS